MVKPRQSFDQKSWFDHNLFQSLKARREERLQKDKEFFKEKNIEELDSACARELLEAIVHKKELDHNGDCKFNGIGAASVFVDEFQKRLITYDTAILSYLPNLAESLGFIFEDFLTKIYGGLMNSKVLYSKNSHWLSKKEAEFIKELFLEQFKVIKSSGYLNNRGTECPKCINYFIKNYGKIIYLKGKIEEFHFKKELLPYSQPPNKEQIEKNLNPYFENLFSDFAPLQKGLFGPGRVTKDVPIEPVIERLIASLFVLPFYLELGINDESVDPRYSESSCISVILGVAHKKYNPERISLEDYMDLDCRKYIWEAENCPLFDFFYDRSNEIKNRILLGNLLGEHHQTEAELRMGLTGNLRALHVLSNFLNYAPEELLPK